MAGPVYCQKKKRAVRRGRGYRGRKGRSRRKVGRRRRRRSSGRGARRRRSKNSEEGIGGFSPATTEEVESERRQRQQQQQPQQQRQQQGIASEVVLTADASLRSRVFVFVELTKRGEIFPLLHYLQLHCLWGKRKREEESAPKSPL